MAKLKKSKKQNSSDKRGPAKKKFKPKNNKNTKKNQKNKNSLIKKNQNTSNNQGANKTEDAKKGDIVPKFEKSNAKSSFNKLKTAKSSAPGKPNMDLKKYKKSENLKEDTTGDKPNWLEFKKQSKELREKRRARKLDTTYETAVAAKKLGEQLRTSKIDSVVKEKLTKKFHDLVQDKYAKMIFMHDLSRVIQWEIKYCGPDIQLAIVQELKPYLKEMIHSKYARNVIKSLLKRGSDDVKKCILESCHGNVVKLLSSVIPSIIFEKIYVEVATEKEKILFKQEFYGDFYKRSKDPNIKTLTDSYKSSESMKTATLSAVKANLVKILNKNLINSTLVHTVLYEYLSNCSKDDRNEILALVRPMIADLSQTKDGTKVGNMCIWYGTNKDRKLIMKALKEHVTKIITSEHGYLMILCLLDTVDDTVLLKKIILPEVLNNINEIVLNEYGRKVILSIVARRDKCFFHPSLISYLSEGDGNEASKKPADIREKELLDHVIDGLLQNIESNVKLWLSNGSIQFVTLAILKASTGDKARAAYKSIAQFLCDVNSNIEKDGEKVKAVDDAGLHMILKKLIKLDAKRRENEELTFGEVLIEYMTDETVKQWIAINRGCFLIVHLLENESEDVIDQLKLRLKKQNFNSVKSTGATILLKKLNTN